MLFLISLLPMICSYKIWETMIQDYEHICECYLNLLV
jgi:hypothetical protein